MGIVHSLQEVRPGREGGIRACLEPVLSPTQTHWTAECLVLWWAHSQDWFWGLQLALSNRAHPQKNLHVDEGSAVTTLRFLIFVEQRPVCLFALGPMNDTVDPASSTHGHGASYTDPTSPWEQCHRHTWDGRYCCGHLGKHNLPLGSCGSLSPECLRSSFPPQPLSKAGSMSSSWCSSTLGPGAGSVPCLLGSHSTLPSPGPGHPFVVS